VLDTIMNTTETSPALRRLFAELITGANNPKGSFILNRGDIGLLRALDQIPAADASRSVNDGATIAAHVQHVRFGLSLMNRWAAEGGDPFANAKWDEAWKMSAVDDAAWAEIRAGFRDEAERWSKVLSTPREVNDIEFTGLMSSIAHLAYHLGAIRQINTGARGPKEGTF
jgi:hypothetical protein